jgi:hypothetical protein
MKNYFLYLRNLLLKMNNHVYPYNQKMDWPEYALIKPLRSPFNPYPIPKPL